MTTRPNKSTSVLPATDDRQKYWVPSDRLREIRQVLARSPEIARLVGEPVHARLIVDSNAVLADVRWLARDPKRSRMRTALMEIADAGSAVLCAPTALVVEVQRHLPGMAQKDKLEVSHLNAVWQEYRKKLHLFPVPDDLLRPYATSVDPDDAPFVALQKLLSAHAIVTRDPHISAMGGKAVSLDIVLCMRDYSRSAAIELSLKVGGVGLCFAGVIALKALLTLWRQLGTAFNRLRPNSQIVVFLIVTAALLHPGIRKRAASVVSDIYNGLQTAGLNLADQYARFDELASIHGVNARALELRLVQELGVTVPPRIVQTIGAIPPRARVSAPESIGAARRPRRRRRSPPA